MSILRKIQYFLIESTRKRDYFYLFLVGLHPIVLSYFLGIHQSSNSSSPYKYLGYWDAFNWTSFIITLPASLFLLRWISKVLFGLPENRGFSELPPLTRLFENEHQKNNVKNDLKRIALAPRTIIVPFILNIIFQIFDSQTELSKYFSYWAKDSANIDSFDWGYAFLVKKNYVNADIDISIAKNLFFYGCANLCEFSIIFIGTLILLLALQHNLFFLGLIYQRDRYERCPNKCYAVINFQDKERSFGLRCTHKAFNLQVFVLVAAGCIMLVTRYAHVSDVPWPQLSIAAPNTWFPEILTLVTLSQLFPSFGQIAAITAWIFSLYVVLLPSLIKFLPILSRTVRAKGLSLTSYLEQFIPPENEQGIYQLINDDQISEVAAQFARNSFWPGGDDIAKFILYFAALVLIVLLFPISIDMKSSSASVFMFMIFSVVVTAIAIANGFLWFLKQALAHVDQRLVDGKK